MSRSIALTETDGQEETMEIGERARDPTVPALSERIMMDLVKRDQKTTEIFQDRNAHIKADGSG